MIKTASTLALLGLSAGLASAQSLPAGMYMEGDVVYEYYADGDGNNLSMFVFDTTIGMQPSAGGSFPIGAEAYLKYVYSDEASLDFSVFGGIVYYESSIGRFSLGTPRSTIPDYVDTISLGGYYDNSAFSLHTGGFTKLFGDLLGETNYGIRYDGDFGDLSVGASYHEFPDFSESSFTISARYDFGNVDVALGYERFGLDDIIFASASTTYGPLDANLTLTQQSGGTLTSGIELSYEVMPELELGLTYVNFGGSDDISILSAEYAFYQNAYVGARYFSAFIDGDPAYSIYAGYNLNF